MIITNFYLNCFLIGIIGVMLSTITVLLSLTRKAKVANVQFNWKLFFGADIFIQLLGSIITVGGALLLVGPFLKQYPKFANNDFAILLAFATIGYFGSDIASRLFSVVNSRINGAIDYKTNQADEANGTLGIRTPATKQSNN